MRHGQSSRQASHGTVSVRSVWPALSALTAMNLDIAPTLVAAGVDPSQVTAPEGRIPHQALLAIWTDASARSGDIAFGIHAAERISPGAFDVVDYTFRLSATLGEGLERLVRYHRVIHDTAPIELRIEGDVASLNHALPKEAGAVPRQIAEFIVSTWLVMARQATGQDFAPRQVNFRHPAPEDLREHARLFRAPVRFSSAANGIDLPSSLLDAPLLKSDPGLCAILERGVEEALSRLPASAGVSDRARRLLADTLSLNTSAESLAKKLTMSRSTMHRQLQNEGTTFKALLEGLRQELAARYLAERRVSVGEVAFLLGFSETSAFHRAFKRWQGVTPAQYRASLSSR